MAKTYYMTTDISAVGKKLARLSGWEKDVADILVSKDADKISKLLAMLQPLASGEDASINKVFWDEIIPLLPKSIRSKARIFLHHAQRFLKVDKDGLVELGEGTRGSSLLDVLKFYCSPASMPVPLPLGTDAMDQLMRQHHMPISAFGKGRHPYHTQTSPPSSPPWIVI